MRSFVLALFLAGCDPWADVEKANTIEGYESYLRDHPDSTYKPQAEAKLAKLYLEKARAAKTLEAYDEFVTKFPKSSLVKDAMKERKEFLWQWADEQDSVESW